MTGEHAGRIVTICFHGIGRPSRSLEPGEERFWIEPNQYREILSAIEAHPQTPDLTFDDGNASDVEFGLPGLIEHRAKAQFFIITDRIGEQGSVTESGLNELVSAGMTLGTHGATHRPWTDLATEGKLDQELTDSCAMLADVAGVPVSAAAMPQGLYNRSVLTATRRHGFRRVYSVDEGWSRPSSWLRSRYSVIQSDTPESISAYLTDPNRTAGPRALQTVKRALKRVR